jgi:hypothetical protein
MPGGPQSSSSPGPSSVGRMSPEAMFDLTTGMGSPPPSMRERGRRVTKKRTGTGETVTDKDAGPSGTQNAEGWVVDSPVSAGGGDHGEEAGTFRGDEHGDQSETDDEINEALVGAILKRPESMRLRSKSSRDSGRETTTTSPTAAVGDSSSPTSSSSFAHPGYLAGGGYGGGVYGSGEDAVVTFPSISNSMPLYMPSARLRRGSGSPSVHQGQPGSEEPVQGSDVERSTSGNALKVEELHASALSENAAIDAGTADRTILSHNHQEDFHS